MAQVPELLCLARLKAGNMYIDRLAMDMKKNGWHNVLSLSLDLAYLNLKCHVNFCYHL